MPADNRAGSRRSDTATRQPHSRTRSDPSARPSRPYCHLHGGGGRREDSRSLLYRDADIRAEIQRLRTGTRSDISRVPVAQRTSDTSLQQRLVTLLDDNHALREESRKLRDHIAVVLGEQRAATTPSGRRRAPTIGPCN